MRAAPFAISAMPRSWPAGGNDSASLSAGESRRPGAGGSPSSTRRSIDERHQQHEEPATAFSSDASVALSHSVQEQPPVGSAARCSGLVPYTSESASTV